MAPNATLVPDSLVGIDDLGARELVFEILDAGLDPPLALFGGVVLGVLAEIAVLAGHADLAADFRALDLLEVLELLPEPGVALGGHGDGAFHGPGSTPCPRR